MTWLDYMGALLVTLAAVVGLAAYRWACHRRIEAVCWTVTSVVLVLAFIHDRDVTWLGTTAR